MKKELLLLTVCLGALAGCDPAPRNAAVQWVARDAWDSGCAHEAIVERFDVQNRGWKVKGEVYTVDVDATFKLVNPCDTGTDGKAYKQFQSVEFKKTGVEMVPCTREGDKGWALKGQKTTRCWTGPNPPKL